MRTNLLIVALLFFTQLCGAQTPDSTTNGFLHFTIGAPLSQYEHELTMSRTTAPEIRPRYFDYNYRQLQQDKFRKSKIINLHIMNKKYLYSLKNIPPQKAP